MLFVTVQFFPLRVSSVSDAGYDRRQILGRESQHFNNKTINTVVIHRNTRTSRVLLI